MSSAGGEGAAGVLRSIVHGLANLLNFRGRDDNKAFWPYALTISTLALIVGVLPMQSAFDAMRSELFSSGGDMEIVNQLGLEALRAGLLALGVGYLLLLAAIVRRLRDGGKMIYWAFPPLVFGAMVWPVFAALLGNLELFPAAFLGNLIYVASIVWLIVLLTRPSIPSRSVT